MNIFQKLIHKDHKETQEEERGLDKEAKTPGNSEATEYEIVEKEILPEKMICPDCGGITLVGLDFCDKCGGELINHDN